MPMNRHILVLIGQIGAGKTEVGRPVAERVGARLTRSTISAHISRTRAHPTSRKYLFRGRETRLSSSNVLGRRAISRISLRLSIERVGRSSLLCWSAAWRRQRAASAYIQIDLRRE